MNLTLFLIEYFPSKTDTNLLILKNLQKSNFLSNNNILKSEKILTNFSQTLPIRKRAQCLNKKIPLIGNLLQTDPKIQAFLNGLIHPKIPKQQIPLKLILRLRVIKCPGQLILEQLITLGQFL